MLTRPLIRLVDLAYNIYFILLLARVIASWVQPPTHHELMRRFLRFTYEVTEPVLAPIRKMIPLRGIDISPIIALFVLRIIRGGLIQLLIYLGT